MTWSEAVESCPGWKDGAYSALAEPRCAICGYSWYTHRRLGRPAPEQRPPDADDTTPEWATMWAIDDDDGAGQERGAAGGEGE